MRKYLKGLIILGCFIAIGFLLQNIFYSKESNMFTVSVESNSNAVLQVFYGDDYNLFTEDNSVVHIYGGQEKEKVEFQWDAAGKCYIRIDFGEQVGQTYFIDSFEMLKGNEKDVIEGKRIKNILESIKEINDVSVNISDERVVIVTTGLDPYITLDKNTFDLMPFFELKMIFPYILAGILVGILYKYVNIRRICNHCKEVYENRKLILLLSKEDFEARFAGSYFGVIWAFVQPCCTILVFWFVFQIGLRSTPVQDYPYILWLISGLIPWFFFSEAWSNTTNVLLEYSYLVKKMVFKIEILPYVKILSSLVVHSFFIVILILAFGIYGYSPSIYTLQIFYYLICMIFLTLGLGVITCTVMVFFRDLGQILGIVLQFTMWLTPILWNVELIPLKFEWIFKINPLYYIVNGYRKCMMHPQMALVVDGYTVLFWGECVLLFIVGFNLFDKAKKHFADVL